MLCAGATMYEQTILPRLITAAVTNSKQDYVVLMMTDLQHHPAIVTTERSMYHTEMVELSPALSLGHGVDLPQFAGGAVGQCHPHLLVPAARQTAGQLLCIPPKLPCHLQALTRLRAIQDSGAATGIRHCHYAEQGIMTAELDSRMMWN